MDETAQWILTIANDSAPDETIHRGLAIFRAEPKRSPVSTELKPLD